MDLLIGQLVVKDTISVDGDTWTIGIEDDYALSFIDQFIELERNGIRARHYGKLEAVITTKSASFLIDGKSAEFLQIPQSVIEKILELRKYLEDNAGKFRIVVDESA